MPETQEDNQPTIDLSSCDREPIRIPGSIQPHGALLALDPRSFRILQASANTSEWLGMEAGTLLGKSVFECFAGYQIPDLEKDLVALSDGSFGSVSVQLGSVRLPARHLRLQAHLWNDTILVEFESAEATVPDVHDLYELVRSFVADLQSLQSEEAISDLTANKIRHITGFDRVLVYRFNQDWSGTVIAEDRNDRLPSYLDLRFPASDIPAQARELYRLNRLRLIADAGYEQVPLVPSMDPRTDQPLDLTFAYLRSVSPIHVEYMKNMGTAASMSVSILREGRLWGLISCHHSEPVTVPLETRVSCDMLSQMYSLQLAAIESKAESELRIELKAIGAPLLAWMTREDDFSVALRQNAGALRSLTRAGGVATCIDGKCHRFGETPREDSIFATVDWLATEVKEDVYCTDELSAALPQSKEITAVASGLLAVAVSRLHRSYILWFRPETVHTVTWGGDPQKPVSGGSGGRLSPRNSFEQWKEIVRGRSTPWLPAEIEAATELRSGIVSIVLRRAEELAELTAELERSNHELEAFSYSVSHDLRAPFRHIVGYAELLRDLEGAQLSDTARRYLNTITESAIYAGTLVDNLLNLSKIGRATLNETRVDLNTLLQSLQHELTREFDGRRVEWRVSRLPEVWADAVLLRLAWLNLLSNALKYSRTKSVSIIEIGMTEHSTEWIFSVKDNGVGFEMAYVDKLFGVFQRLHSMEEFEGTGIGLANVRRIIARHGGRTWAEGTPGEGATFSFSLPKPGSQREGKRP